MWRSFYFSSASGLNAVHIPSTHIPLQHLTAKEAGKKRCAVYWKEEEIIRSASLCLCLSPKETDIFKAQKPEW